MSPRRVLVLQGEVEEVFQHQIEDAMITCRDAMKLMGTKWRACLLEIWIVMLGVVQEGRIYLSLFCGVVLSRYSWFVLRMKHDSEKWEELTKKRSLTANVLGKTKLEESKSDPWDELEAQELEVGHLDGQFGHHNSLKLLLEMKDGFE